eukprot:CAMPEP_0198726014 /NCGR_PEP_ID=MMETSP1475-20131203/3192_1 /TAXON_ID= ORGANISM="Unidentified sp., Strain CCMP1999" /NCGR_SAMPLE_ID=MMETSP1475 /ASSEMBLY_ACC=CAM_ASM_001111 /LENGTH=271 /DNA_ID=CAMNT_0044487883 /DNA_START=316 /DNA_END=1131 /DNA_ORIENTATION=-
MKRMIEDVDDKGNPRDSESRLHSRRSEEERNKRRKEWNVKHSRKSRERVAHALKELSRVLDGADLRRPPQAEVLMAAAHLIRELSAKNAALKARIGIATEYGRTQTAVSALERSTSPVAAMTFLVDEVFMTVTRRAVAEVWRREGPAGGVQRLSISYSKDLSDDMASEGIRRETIKRIPAEVAKDLSVRVLRSQREEWIRAEDLAVRGDSGPDGFSDRNVLGIPAQLGNLALALIVSLPSNEVLEGSLIADFRSQLATLGTAHIRSQLHLT